MAVEQVLSDIIGDRDTLSMSVIEAKKVLKEFYLRIEVMTVGYYDPHKMDYLCNKALKRHHLDLLAAS